MFTLKITTLNDEKDLSQLLHFMSQQSQFYPNYKDWVYGKCKSRMESGRYKSIIAFSNNIIIGNAVYDFIDKHYVELKNFRIDSKYQNRSLGYFLLMQLANETNGANIGLDVSVDNFKGVEFFIHNGFKIVDRKNLYSPNQSEYIMKKILQ